MGARKLAVFLVFVACAAALAAGFWYFRSDDLGDEEPDVAEDEDAGTSKTDGGVPRRRLKKKASDSKGKANDARHAHAKAPRQPGEPPPSADPGGVSYEAAIAGNNLKLAPGTQIAPDLTDAELSFPMRDGSFLDACGVPRSTRMTVKVAIREGHAVGVSVYPTPPSAPLARCVERHVRGLRWPHHMKMDSFVTSY